MDKKVQAQKIKALTRQFEQMFKSMGTFLIIISIVKARDEKEGNFIY